MAINSGFFNSVSGDRKYDAEDINKFFDGVITDGVLSNIGEILDVVPSSGMQVAIESGKAWFLKSWIENTADAFRTLSDSDLTYDRIDIIAIDFDKSDQVRENDIVIVEGTPASSPVPPTLIDTATHLQKPLAHILVEANETVITSGDITIKVDTVDCPFSTGIVDLIVEVDDVTIQIVANELSVKNFGIDTNQLQSGAVTGMKLANGAVDSEHYTNLSIDREHLEADIIDGTKIANDVVNSEHYAAGSIDEEHIANDAVTNVKMRNSSGVSVIGRAANSVGDPGDIAAGANYHVLRRFANALGWGLVGANSIEADAVDDTKVGDRVPMFTRRQGGSPTIWSTFGDNDYTVGAVKMQGGVKNIGVIADSALSSLITITFPQAFAYNPIIQMTAYANTSYGFLRVQSISTTAITFDFKNQGLQDTFKAHWLAIGEEA